MKTQLKHERRKTTTNLNNHVSKHELVESVFAVVQFFHLHQPCNQQCMFVLFYLYQQVNLKHLNQDHNNMEWFSQNYKKILDYLNENIRKSTRKSVLSALYVLTNRPEYHEQMIEDAKDINDSETCLEEHPLLCRASLALV